MLGVSRQAAAMIWSAPHGFDAIQSCCQCAFVLAREWKGSREVFQLIVPPSWLGFGENLSPCLRPA